MQIVEEKTKRRDGLMDYSWSGSLAKQIYRHNPAAVWMIAALSVLVALVPAVGLFLFTGNTQHLALVVVIAPWGLLIGIPVLYQLSVRDIRILRPLGPGLWELDFQHWWKDDIGELDESQARYENGRRVFWVIEKPGESGYHYFNPESLNLKRRNNDVDSSEVYGLAGYVASGSAYVFRKARSLSDTIKLGVLALVIGGELIMLFMLVGNLTDASSN